MRKHLLYMFLVCSICLSMSACGKNEELPSDIGQVGDSITKEQDTLDSSDIEYDSNGIPSGETDAAYWNKVSVSGEEGNAATVADVKEWISAYVSGNYTTTKDADDENLVYENATMKDGGTVSIKSYYDGYFMTEFKFDPKSDILKPLSEYLSAYIGRPLATSEQESLNSTIEATKTGGEMQFVSGLRNSVTCYLLIDNGAFYTQIK